MKRVMDRMESLLRRLQSIDSIFQFAKEHMDPEEEEKQVEDHEEETEQDEVDL